MQMPILRLFWKLCCIRANATEELRGEKMSEIEVPKLDWEYRCRRMIDIAYTILGSGMRFVADKYGKEASIELYKKVQPAMSAKTAAKLLKEYEIAPTVEGALKLAKLYSAEVWGFGADEYVSGRMISPNKGIYVNKKCRMWEKRKELGIAGLQCNETCIEEYRELIKMLSPDLKVTMTKAIPLGNSICEYSIELES
jgi:hypothetical protein